MPRVVLCPKCRAEVPLPDRKITKTCCLKCKTVFSVQAVASQEHKSADNSNPMGSGQIPKTIGPAPITDSGISKKTLRPPVPQSKVIEGLAISRDELTNTKREIRHTRWQNRRIGARLRILRIHKAYFESFGLHNEGWLAPSLVLGAPVFAVGAIAPLAVRCSLLESVLVGGFLFVSSSICFALFYRAMPYSRIVQESKRLQHQKQINQDMIDTFEQRRNELAISVETMEEAESERAYHRQQIQSRIEMEEIEKIQRIREIVGYQRADPWGSVAICFSTIALVLAILGFFTCGTTYIIALPFALAGFVFALLSRSERRGVALALSLIALAPLIILLLIRAAM